MKDFFDKLPKHEDDFVGPLLAYWIDFCKQPMVQNPNEERVNVQRIKYSNLYRTLASLKHFYRGN